MYTHREDYCGQREFAGQFPGYPHYGLEFVISHINEFSSIHLYKESCSDKVWQGIDHELKGGFLSISALDQLNKKALEWIRLASDYCGHYSVFYRSSSKELLDQFMKMHINSSELILFESQTDKEHSQALEKLMASHESDQYYIAFSHDVEFAGIFGSPVFLENTKTGSPCIH